MFLKKVLKKGKVIVQTQLTTEAGAEHFDSFSLKKQKEHVGELPYYTSKSYNPDLDF